MVEEEGGCPRSFRFYKMKVFVSLLFVTAALVLVRATPRVSRESERHITVNHAKQIDRYYLEDLESQSHGPEHFCDIKHVSQDDCETYADELKNMHVSIRQMLTTKPEVMDGPMTLLLPAPVYAQRPEKLSNDLDTPLERLEKLESALQEGFKFVEEFVFTGRDNLPIVEVLPMIRQTGSLFQRVLFNWHYHTFDKDMYDRLAPDEIAYISTFFELYGLEHYNFRFGFFYGNRMSSFTYSHRRKGDGPINSGRFACGTTSQERPFAFSVAPIIERLGIKLDPWYEQHPADFSFYGLGWDHPKKYLKLYIMFHDLTKLPPHHEKLTLEKIRMANITDDPAHMDVASHGLISYTYIVDYDTTDDKHLCEVDPATGEGTCRDSANPAVTLHEEKVYIYPNDDEVMRHATRSEAPHLAIPDGVVGVAWMFASRRDFVPQYDIRITPESLELWKDRVGKPGTAIMENYEKIDLYLETMNYNEESGEYVLYFPAGSG